MVSRCHSRIWMNWSDRNDVSISLTSTARLRKKGLNAREVDVADRQSTIDRILSQIDQSRVQFNQSVADFNKRFIELKVDEEVVYKGIARTVATLEPAVARDLILDYWKTQDGQVKAVKILAVMDKERVDEIIGLMEIPNIKQVIESRTKLVRESLKAKK